MRSSGSSSSSRRATSLDERVVAAGVEEGVPVAPAPFEEVLATGGVRQHTVDVEDHRRPRSRRARCASANWAVSDWVDVDDVSDGAHSSVGAGPTSRRISSTTRGSASVVVSPRSRPSATSRSSRRMILPRPGLGQLVGEDHRLGPGDGPDLLGHVAPQLLAALVGRLLAGLAG